MSLEPRKQIQSPDIAAVGKSPSGKLHVLQEIVPRLISPPPGAGPFCNGIVIDLRTTGLRPGYDEIVEIVLLPFSYAAKTGVITAIGAPYHGLHQPSFPLPAKVTALTGLDATAVSGQEIDLGVIDNFVHQADVVVAHDAYLVRGFAEQLCPALTERSWACSFHQIPWHAEGISSAELSCIAAVFGLLLARSDPLHRCYAVLDVLSRPLPKSSHSGFYRMLYEARKTTYRIWADAVPTKHRDELASRGYRWHNGSGGGPSAWHIEIDETYLASELAYLQSSIYRYSRGLAVERVTARERFTSRSLSRSFRA